ncbi:MAG: hypothetical protein AVDCRST_MAG59-1449, partial [uncultured Thermomicrobiales bacterium]
VAALPPRSCPFPAGPGRATLQGCAGSDGREGRLAARRGRGVRCRQPPGDRRRAAGTDGGGSRSPVAGGRHRRGADRPGTV